MIRWDYRVKILEKKFGEKKKSKLLDNEVETGK